MSASKQERYGGKRRMRAVKKVQVNFDEAAMRVIGELQEAYGGATVADVIRDALGFYNWARIQRRAGLSVGTIRGKDAVERVLLPFEISINGGGGAIERDDSANSKTG